MNLMTSRIWATVFASTMIGIWPRTAGIIAS